MPFLEGFVRVVKQKAKDYWEEGRRIPFGAEPTPIIEHEGVRFRGYRRTISPPIRSVRVIAGGKEVLILGENDPVRIEHAGKVHWYEARQLDSAPVPLRVLPDTD